MLVKEKTSLTLVPHFVAARVLTYNRLPAIFPATESKFLSSGVLQIESGGTPVDSGKWWFHDACFCFRLEKMTGGRTQFCCPVVDGRRVRFYDPASGTLAFTLFRPGR